MELNNVTENIPIGNSNINITTANQGRKKTTEGPWLMHFFRLGKMCVC